MISGVSEIFRGNEGGVKYGRLAKSKRSLPLNAELNDSHFIFVVVRVRYKVINVLSENVALEDFFRG